MRRYEIREDALRYARSHATAEWQDRDILVVIGHDPDGRRYRFSCPRERETHVLTFRPIG
jgi:hypothetical protein